MILNATSNKSGKRRHFYVDVKCLITWHSLKLPIYFLEEKRFKKRLNKKWARFNRKLLFEIFQEIFSFFALFGVF